MALIIVATIVMKQVMPHVLVCPLILIDHHLWPPLTTFANHRNERNQWQHIRNRCQHFHSDHNYYIHHMFHMCGHCCHMSVPKGASDARASAADSSSPAGLTTNAGSPANIFKWVNRFLNNSRCLHPIVFTFAVRNQVFVWTFSYFLTNRANI